jgi:hypothetical protein
MLSYYVFQLHICIIFRIACLMSYDRVLEFKAGFGWEPPLDIHCPAGTTSGVMAAVVGACAFAVSKNRMGRTDGIYLYFLCATE